MIIDSVPRDKQGDYGSPLGEGFNNLTFNLDQIREVLQRPQFENKHLTAIGKTEWADIAWNDHSIADKKNLINSVDLVFISSASVKDWEKARDHLKASGVNRRLLDCSDAHYFLGSDQKDRIGKCFTWIKADPTFEGLLLATKEFDERVFVGDEPEKIKNVRENRTKYITSIRLSRVPESDSKELWFDDTVKLNTGLVAIIGNKGSGKSALTDTIGLLGNSRNERHFSFLHKDRFREPKDNKARLYQATLAWESGSTLTRRLDEQVSGTSVELVKYIPQHFLETVCNEIKLAAETDFDRELKGVIFSHVETADRLGKDSLDALLAYKTEETNAAIDILKAELSQINKEIADLEAKSTKEHRQSIEEKLRAREKELESHDISKPPEVPPPAVDPPRQKEINEISSEIGAAKKAQQGLAIQIEQARREQNENTLLISSADKALSKIDNLVQQYKVFVQDISKELSALGISLESVVTLTVNKEPLNEKRRASMVAKLKADALLDSKNAIGLVYKTSQTNARIDALQAKLDEPNKRYQAYITELQKWTEKRTGLVGNSEIADSIEGYRSQLKKLEEIPAQVAARKQRRIEKVKEIYDRVAGLANDYRQYYRPVRDFIQNHPLAKDKLQLNFEVSIVDTTFRDKFFDYVHQGVSGSFFGDKEGKSVLENIIEKYDFNDWARARGFLQDVIDHLENDKRPGASAKVRIAEQLKKGHTVQELYDFVFSLAYLSPRYTLRLGDRDLHQLSPGEKGTLLLIFYLLVDRGDVPLVIDQPEENLDNQTVVSLLVPCIKEAKQRRQILIVTHNPNLAVVCDAEQIVYASENKKGRKRIAYTSGAIENPIFNKKTVDVLEGTRPAFDNRDSKYFPEGTP